MNKNIFFIVLVALFLNACVSTNILRFGELDTDTANKDEIINNFEGNILNLEVPEDIERMSLIVPKDNLTLRVKIKVANIEDVLYMNIIDNSKFSVNKLIKRVSDINELDIKQDGWMFEPSIEKGMITLQLYLPEVYLYNSQYNPKLLFSYKRGSRALQETIQFNFVKQHYFPSKDEDGYEIAKFDDLPVYCEQTGKGVSEEFINQIEQLNPNRVGDDLKQTLQGICE
jgi:hypothetical protein